MVSDDWVAATTHNLGIGRAPWLWCVCTAGSARTRLDLMSNSGISAAPGEVGIGAGASVPGTHSPEAFPRRGDGWCGRRESNPQIEFLRLARLPITSLPRIAARHGASLGSDHDDMACVVRREGFEPSMRGPSNRCVCRFRHLRGARRRDGGCLNRATSSTATREAGKGGRDHALPRESRPARRGQQFDASNLVPGTHLPTAVTLAPGAILPKRRHA